ncbi:MAG: hypothetical protein DRR19_27540 [Candidatus Parabeggiatoa sp. nov. 1]|nr:MAG: hypothetical protein DRR19_27540 [Gammaproteobacteria bacterium]
MGCRGFPKCSPRLNLMALTLQRGNAFLVAKQRVLFMQSATLTDFRGNAVPHRATRAGMIGFLA